MDIDHGHCAACGAEIVPFGRFGHRFVYDAVGALCLECAKRTIPSVVAAAEAAEAALSDSKKD